jgi:hypothetical protein
MSKRKRTKAIARPRTWATPSKERRNQNGGLIWKAIPSSIRPGQTIRRYRAVWESPLDAYRAHGVISIAEYRAGLRFHRAYYGVVLCRRPDYRPTGEEQAAWKETTVEKLLKLARRIIAPEDLNAAVEICGHSQPARNPRALTCLKRGLGDLASQWDGAAKELCEQKKQ